MLAKPTKILVPIDFSNAADQALDYGAQVADWLGASLCVLHCTPMGDLVHAAASARHPEKAVEIVEHEDQARLQKRVERMAVGGQHPKAILRVGPAPATILDVAGEEGADLIVMSTHGRTGLRHAVIGSVAEEVVRKSPIPVLTFRPSKTTD